MLKIIEIRIKYQIKNIKVYDKDDTYILDDDN